MSDAEHLIENVIFAMKRGELVSDELGRRYNQEMLKNTGIREADLARMASHIVYVLYDGRFPSGPVETNYERITGGNVERFVDWLDHGYYECAWCDGNCSRYDNDCQKCIVAWMNQEAK